MSVVEPQIAAPLKAAPAVHVIPRAGWFLIFILCSLIFGISVTESVSNSLLPLTIHRFTPNPRTISYILAINPLFGFIAQPIVGVLSDHVWSRLGRRALFLIIGAPVVAGCLLGIPWCWALWQLVVLVFIYQFFEDVLYGSDSPLVADLVPPEQRSVVVGAMATAAGLAGIFVLQFGMPLADRYGEVSLYGIAAAAQILFVCLAAFFLHERPHAKQPRPKLTVKRYVTDLVHQPMLFRLAWVNFFKSLQSNAIIGYVSLYAVQTLHFNKGDFGTRWSWGSWLALALAYFIGTQVERFRKNRAMILGCGISLVAYVMGFASHSLLDLAIVGVMVAIGDQITGITHKAFMTEYMAHDLTGQLSGATNIFYATGRTLSLLIVGELVHQFHDNYRVIWAFAAAVAVINIAILLTVRDERFESRMIR